MTPSTLSRRTTPALLAILIAGCASTHGLSPHSTLRDVDRLSTAESLSKADVSPPPGQMLSGGSRSVIPTSTR
ncbi:hypothetical protein [Solilutibacter tolerans]|uniref:hypothetical protein n=1 Tax=Solilutibacter tolerans TaxID=1604334 RepID=UPI001F6253C2|nr:hypothetical protein [Lysobacter tolerans]